MVVAKMITLHTMLTPSCEFIKKNWVMCLVSEKKSLGTALTAKWPAAQLRGLRSDTLLDFFTSVFLYARNHNSMDS